MSGEGSQKRPFPRAGTTFKTQDGRHTLKLTPLGAGQEVGRSCILLEFKGKRVLFDCGLHPVHAGLSALPFIDEMDPSQIDVLLVTHFHVDHAGALPYLLEKTTFAGRVFMTHPTKAIYKWLLTDYVKMSNLSSRDKLYDEQDLNRSYNKIEVIDYHQEVEIEGIKFTPYYAGHVLGAAMFLLEIAGVKILYTGDYSREEDRHLKIAECPHNVTPDILICESTYGVQSHEPRPEREARFTSIVHDIVTRGGRCLLPVFALGRAQEFLLILEEYWRQHPELHDIPIYYTSSLAKKCMSVYQTYTNMMNARIMKSKASNPFQFKFINNLKITSHFDDIGPCVMIASPGMLQNGLSRELLELWCTNEKNGVIILGYVVEGTLGKHILSRPESIPTLSGGTLPLKMSVDYISFSAHVDYPQNYAFIEQIAAQTLVLVHGESNEMMRLRSALRNRYAEKNTPLKIFTPKNCEIIKLYFHGERVVKVLGSLAKDLPSGGVRISGIMVGRDFSYQLTEVNDLKTYTDLHPAEITQKQYIRCYAPADLIFWHLSKMFGKIEIMGKRKAFIFDSVLIEQTENGRIWILSWKGHPISDTISDSIAGIILMCQTSPASVIETKSLHSCSSPHNSHFKSDYDENLSDDNNLAQNDASMPVIKKPKLLSDSPSHLNMPYSIAFSESGSSDDLGSDFLHDGLLSTSENAPLDESCKDYLLSLLEITLFLNDQFGKSNVLLHKAYYNNRLVYLKDTLTHDALESIPDFAPDSRFNPHNDDNNPLSNYDENFLSSSSGKNQTLPTSIAKDEYGVRASWILNLDSIKSITSYTDVGVIVSAGSEELKRRVIAVLTRAWRTVFPISESFIPVE